MTRNIALYGLAAVIVLVVNQFVLVEVPLGYVRFETFAVIYLFGNIAAAIWLGRFLVTHLGDKPRPPRQPDPTRIFEDYYRNGEKP